MNHPAVLRGALIGCGFVSRFHLEGWARVPDVRLIALCDLDAVRLRRASALAPGARLYERAEALLAAERPDFVEIRTRPESHRALVELAARHGAHVLCQKPAAPDRADLEAMI
ncbi:MAG TPA: Gfo/Idh/MocA family oxidoreductase [Isosphaeraceae bacterium]|jgi:predicted dehydrogenase